MCEKNILKNVCSSYRAESTIRNTFSQKDNINIVLSQRAVILSLDFIFAANSKKSADSTAERQSGTNTLS